MNNTTKIQQFRSFVSANSDWKEDAWGNLKTTKSNGKEYRITFKERVARYEVRSSSGTWTRLYSASLKELDAVMKDGRIKMKGFK